MRRKRTVYAEKNENLAYTSTHTHTQRMGWEDGIKYEMRTVVQFISAMNADSNIDRHTANCS